jgi:hypothetical protein
MAGALVMSFTVFLIGTGGSPVHVSASKDKELTCLPPLHQVICPTGPSRRWEEGGRLPGWGGVHESRDEEDDGRYLAGCATPVEGSGGLHEEADNQGLLVGVGAGCDHVSLGPLSNGADNVRCSELDDDIGNRQLAATGVSPARSEVMAMVRACCAKWKDLSSKVSEPTPRALNEDAEDGRGAKLGSRRTPTAGSPSRSSSTTRTSRTSPRRSELPGAASARLLSRTKAQETTVRW